MSSLHSKLSHKPSSASPFTPGLRMAGEPSETVAVYIETYGCQMNVNDSEVVASILGEAGYRITENPAEAGLILLNTCAVRDNAEQKVRSRLAHFGPLKRRRPGLLVGVLGCMAERLKEQLLEEEQAVDIVAGPDAYRDLPQLLQQAGTGQKAINVLLSREETYADISPVRMDKNGVSSFVSIMRGCNNMCAYCIVPYTRGGERSRNPRTIMQELQQLCDAGYKEVTLLGQNVDSYLWSEGRVAPLHFADLLSEAAVSFPELRIRFSTSHPKDMSTEVVQAIAAHANLCKSIHLPAQSGSTRLLEVMKRGYSRETYLEKISSIRTYLPQASISTDLIAGFSTETEADHAETLSLMQEVGYDFAFMFKYSVRPRTYAHRHYQDDVPEEIKARRLQEIIDLQNHLSLQSKKRDVGQTFEVLVEGVSKRSATDLAGRTSQNKVVVFPGNGEKPGDLVQVKIVRCSSATLFGEPIL